MNEDFENRLSRQPPREIPAAWRTEILASAREGRRVAVPKQKWDASMASLPSFLRQLLSTINYRPSTTLRWTALAAVWAVIFTLNHAARDTSPVILAKATLPSPQMILALREQRKLLSELTELPNLTSPTDRPKPHPRSQRKNGAHESLINSGMGLA